MPESKLVICEYCQKHAYFLSPAGFETEDLFSKLDALKALDAALGVGIIGYEDGYRLIQKISESSLPQESDGQIPPCHMLWQTLLFLDSILQAMAMEYLISHCDHGTFH